MEKNVTELSLRIKHFRKLRGLSQDELAGLSGINVSMIKKYENGFRNPKPEAIEKIAKALGISIHTLMDFKIETVSDIISLLMKMDEQSCMEWTGKKDDDGSYIPSSVQLSFQDSSVNEVLAKYMTIRDWAAKPEKEIPVDIRAEYEDVELLIEDTKSRLVINDTQVKKPQ